MIVDRDTSIYVEPGLAASVDMAVEALERDLASVLGQRPKRATRPGANQVRIGERPDLAEECFRVDVGEDSVVIEGSGLGVVFGIYHFSTHDLGIDPFHAWSGVQPDPAESLELSTSIFVSTPHPVRHRGWFVNDEDCLRGMSEDGQIEMATWAIVFETILRIGWNMVIPGTGIRADDPQLDLADRMGLTIAQHHSEPLGARLYSEVYDEESQLPHPLEDRERYDALYNAAIDEGGRRDVVWTVGLRGQGDEPFDQPDSDFIDDAQRGLALTSAIAHQRRLVEERLGPGQQFVHYLYAESARLYQDNNLKLDEDVLPVWSDNGFGAMRIRRDWGPEPDVPALPSDNAHRDRVGIYYHVSFHDLQASGLLVPHVHPTDIVTALGSVAKRSSIDFFVLNVGNIRPHLFAIELVAELLAKVSEPEAMDGFAGKHVLSWAGRYFPAASGDVPSLINDYYDAAYRYGSHPDERAGDEFYHNTLRRLIAAVVKGHPIDTHLTFMQHASGEDRAVLAGLLPEAQRTVDRLARVEERCSTVYPDSSHPEQRFFRQAIWMPIRFMRVSATSFIQAIGGLIDFLDCDYESSFRRFSRSSTLLEGLWRDLASTATGHWRHFYRGEWLVDVRETRRVIRTMQGLAFLCGDTGHREISRWTAKAFGLEESLLAPVRQASTDYDTLGRALDEMHSGTQRRIADLIRRADEGSD